MSIQSVCVYCSASKKIDQKYFNFANDLGKALAQEHFTLVYGGGSFGLMGEVSRAALDHNGTVIGVIPEFLCEKECPNYDLTELLVVENMHERKTKMFERSDALIILPGGFGTMEELLEVITWKQLGLHDKPIILANFDGFWQPFLDMVDKLRQEHFLHNRSSNIFEVAHDVASIMACLK